MPSTVTQARQRASGRSLAPTVRLLRACCQQFGDASARRKLDLLQSAAAKPLTDSPALVRYHDTLLFMAAHPDNAAVRRLVASELARMSQFLRSLQGKGKSHLHNQGMPFAPTLTRFTHDCVRWLLGHPAVRVTPSDWVAPTLDLSAVLRLTLPALERDLTSMDLNNTDLLQALGLRPSQVLPFLVQQLAQLDDHPLLKDQLFDSLDLYVHITPRRRQLSKAYNRLASKGPYFQTALLRQFDHVELMNRALPQARSLTPAARDDAIEVIKNTMLLTARETDPATYLKPESLRIFDLERGLSVAIFGMQAQRQLPGESYFGFTLFKNGLAVSYGGAWMLGERAAFGMNIFEPYRGGESGYMMCQLLRTYRQVFGVQYFEVDAHQFGRDNPDGIASGAFWFYYRYGFRPLTTELQRLAQRERDHMATRPGHRSSHSTLQRFCQSNVALNFGQRAPLAWSDVTARVTRLIGRRYAGQRDRAGLQSVQWLSAQVPGVAKLSAESKQVLVDVALMAQALGLTDPSRLRLGMQMAQVKPTDEFRYQSLMQQFLAP